MGIRSSVTFCLMLAAATTCRTQEPVKTPDTLIAQADARQKDHDYEAAASLWSSVVGEFPDDPRLPMVRHKLALCLIESGKPGEAADQCRILLETSPKGPRAKALRLLLATALVGSAGKAATDDPVAARRQFAEAGEAIRDLLKDPEKPEDRAFLLYQLGVVATGMADPDESARAFDAFLADFPVHDLLPEVRLRRGSLWIEKAEMARAEPLLRQAAEAAGFAFADVATDRLAECLHALGRKDNAIATMMSIRERFPKSRLVPGAIARSAGWMAAERRFEEARGHVTLLIKQGTAEAVDAVLDLASLSAQSEPRCAETVTTAALVSFPGHRQEAELRFWRGVALTGLQEYENANAELKQARGRRLLPARDAEASHLIASNLARLGKYDDAIVVLDALLTSNEGVPRDVLLYERAQSVEASRPALAAEAYERVATHSPDSPLVADSLVRSGEHHAAAGAFEDAARCFAAAIPSATDAGLRDFARSRLGWTQLELRQDERAAATFDLLVQGEPGDALLAAGLYFGAVAQERAGHAALALERYSKAAETGSAYSAPSLLGAGEASLKLGKPDEAGRCFARLLAADPKSPRAQEARLGLARVQQVRGEWQRAESDYNALIKERVGSRAEARAQLHLAEVYLRENKPRQAAVAFSNVEGYGFDDLSAEGLKRAAEGYRALGDERRALEAQKRLAALNSVNEVKWKAAAVRPQAIPKP